MDAEQKIREAQEKGDLLAEIDAMVEDLESEPAANEIAWAIEALRLARAEVESFDWVVLWAGERVAEWTRRDRELTARGLAIRAAGGRPPRPSESANDLEREAERIRRGEVARALPEATREREAALLDETASLLRDVTALKEEVLAAVNVVCARLEVSAENDVARDHIIRTAARLLDDTELLQRLNQERRARSGRARPKKK